MSQLIGIACIIYIVTFIAMVEIMHNWNLKRIKKLPLRRIVGISLLVLAPVTLVVWLLILLLGLLWELVRMAAKALARYTGMDE